MKKKATSTKIFLACLVCLFISFIILVKSYAQPSSQDWSLEDVQNYLGSQIPTDAKDIILKGSEGRGGFLDLSFKADPSSINSFVQPICEGILYPEYDPFNAVDVGEPFTFAHRIQLDIFTYYSYSLNTPQAILGNRCERPKGGQYQIIVDQSNSLLYMVRVQALYSNCATSCVHIPVDIISFTPELPIGLVGVKQTDSTNLYQLLFSQFCLGVEPDFQLNSPEKWTALIDAKVKISLNDEPLGSVFIAEDGTLVNRRDSKGDTQSIDSSGNSSYYCLNIDKQGGIHSLTISIQTVHDNNPSYTQSFRLIDSGAIRTF